MFEQPTVFILGAGASASYDYPTGTELIKFVRSACKNLETEFLKRNQYIPLQHLPAYCREKYKNGPNKQDGRLICYEEARSFKEFLKVIEKTKPLVIDHFLSDNPSLSETGRFLISWVINECAEKKFDAAAEKDWIRYIQAKLLDGCESTEDLCNPEKNHVHFITFNYDTSLEEILFSRLCSIEKLSQGHAEIQKFIQSAVKHVYGAIDSNPFIKEDHSLHPHHTGLSEEDNQWNRKCDIAYKASKMIQVIENVDKGEQSLLNRKCAKLIYESKKLYILGFGFDHRNCQRIDLSNFAAKDSAGIIERNRGKSLYYTNMGNKNSVNKRVNKIFFDNEYCIPTSIGPAETIFNVPFDKSSLSVAEAFSNDFDL